MYSVVLERYQRADDCKPSSNTISEAGLIDSQHSVASTVYSARLSAVSLTIVHSVS